MGDHNPGTKLWPEPWGKAFGCIYSSLWLETDYCCCCVIIITPSAFCFTNNDNTGKESKQGNLCNFFVCFLPLLWSLCFPGDSLSLYSVRSDKKLWPQENLGTGHSKSISQALLKDRRPGPRLLTLPRAEEPVQKWHCPPWKWEGKSLFLSPPHPTLLHAYSPSSTECNKTTKIGLFFFPRYDVQFTFVIFFFWKKKLAWGHPPNCPPSTGNGFQMFIC